VFIKVNGVRQCLWRAVDQDGNVLDILVQSRRDAEAAKRFIAKLMKKQCRVPRVLVTDKCRSYGPAHRELMGSVEHRSHKGLSNRAENAHQPTRQRERAMKGFRSTCAAQKYLSVFSQVSPHFRPRRHLLTDTEYPTEMHHRFETWNEITGTTAIPTTRRPRDPRPQRSRGRHRAPGRGKHDGVRMRSRGPRNCPAVKGASAVSLI
jgi:putative transposase